MISRRCSLAIVALLMAAGFPMGCTQPHEPTAQAPAQRFHRYDLVTVILSEPAPSQPSDPHHYMARIVVQVAEVRPGGWLRLEGRKTVTDEGTRIGLDITGTAWERDVDPGGSLDARKMEGLKLRRLRQTNTGAWVDEDTGKIVAFPQ